MPRLDADVDGVAIGRMDGGEPGEVRPEGGAPPSEDAPSPGKYPLKNGRTRVRERRGIR